MFYQALLYLLAPFVLLGLLLHVLLGLAVALVIFPPLSQEVRNRIIQIWSRMVLRIVGVRLVAPKNPAAWSRRGCIAAANHISWLDILVLNASATMRFIAKAEIARWPLAGWLVSSVGTLYIERGRRHAVHALNRAVRERLQAGETIGIFPEGTTSDGSLLLPFHANLLQPALDTGAEIRPVALRYSQLGQRSRAAAYVGDDSLAQSLWWIITAPHLTAEAFWLPALPADITNRHAAGRALRAAIGDALALSGDTQRVKGDAVEAKDSGGDAATPSRTIA